MSIVTLVDSTMNPLSLNYTGMANKAASYYGLSRGVHTVQIVTKKFVGRVFVEGSIANNPTNEEDWFAIGLTGTTPYIQFPLDPLTPNDVTGDTYSLAFSFQANILWVRAKIDRTYITNPNPQMLGNVTFIKIAY